MNILIISFSVNGAMGDSFKQIVKMLRVQKDVNIYVLTNENTNLSSSANVHIRAIKFDRKNILSFINPCSYYNIWRFIRKSKYEKVLFYSPHPANILIYKYTRIEDSIFYLHDNEPHSGFPKLDSFFYKKQLDFIYKGKCAIIVSSNTIKHEISILRPYVDQKRVFVIYLWALENLQFSFPDVEETIDILFFGRLEYYKGLDILLEANKYTEVKYNYLIDSKGSLESVFDIAQLPNNFVHKNYYVPDKELAYDIKSSKIVVLPYRDATGTQVIQTAFHYGKPVVATDVGCFPEYITDGLDGIIVPKENPQKLAQAFDKLIKDKYLRRELGEHGKNKLNTIFSNEYIAKQFMDIFKNLSQ